MFLLQRKERNKKNILRADDDDVEIRAQHCKKLCHKFYKDFDVVSRSDKINRMLFAQSSRLTVNSI